MVAFGPCNWTTECQAEDTKRRESITMVRYADHINHPRKCPVCKRDLRIERFFIEERI
jgi:predicted Zn-ribbon and HTH transcriptional regulator